MRGQLGNGTVDAGRRVVDQDVQVAEAIANVGEQLLDAGLVGDVGAQRLDVAASGRFDLGRGAARGLRVANVGDERVRPAAGELEGDGAADATSTAGDQCELASELAAHFSR